jgi:hypothetical protein
MTTVRVAAVRGVPQANDSSDCGMSKSLDEVAK